MTLKTRHVLNILAQDGYALSQPAFNDWINSGVVSPRLVVGRNGSEYRFTLKDVARARLVARLRREGIPLQRIRPALAYLDRKLNTVLEPGTRASLIVEPGGHRAIIVEQPGKAALEVPSGQLRLQLSEVVIDRETAAKFAA